MLICKQYWKAWDTGSKGCSEGFVLRPGVSHILKMRNGSLQSIKHVYQQTIFKHLFYKDRVTNNTPVHLMSSCSKKPLLNSKVRLCWGMVPWRGDRCCSSPPDCRTQWELGASALSRDKSLTLPTNQWQIRRPGTDFCLRQQRPLCVISAIMPLRDFLCCLLSHVPCKLLLWKSGLSPLGLRGITGLKSPQI